MSHGFGTVVGDDQKIPVEVESTLGFGLLMEKHSKHPVVQVVPAIPRGDVAGHMGVKKLSGAAAFSLANFKVISSI